MYDPGNYHLSYVGSKVNYDIIFSLIPTVCLLVLLCAQNCQTNCEGLLETTLCTEPSLGRDRNVGKMAFLHKSLKGEHILETGVGYLLELMVPSVLTEMGWDILGLIMTMEHGFLCESVVPQHNLFSTSRRPQVFI